MFLNKYTDAGFITIKKGRARRFFVDLDLAAHDDLHACGARDRRRRYLNQH
jgi:hypothetical protein